MYNYFTINYIQEGRDSPRGMSVTDEIKARLDIVDIVEESVDLKKSGRNFIGFCPFHANTKTPSFVVFPATQTWRCFGACSEGGDIFSFVMKREGYAFKDALDMLAQRAGIALEPPSPEAAQQQEKNRRLLELNATAAAYFHRLLTDSPAGGYSREYLAGRGIKAETIVTFQLGYALNEWEALKSYLTKQGYKPEEMVAAGLVVARDDGSPGYDRFRNRLVIPIRDRHGRTVGFGGRALGANQVPKYLNTPQTDLFDKSAILYGLDLARKEIRQSGEVVIVEGYMDVIQAHQQGAPNVVAQMGTALTEPQLKQIASLSDKIVLALDADTAGSAATIRSLSLARQMLPKQTRATLTAQGRVQYTGHIRQEIYIAALPPGKDPDDILRQGLAAWQKLVTDAIPALDFYEKLILKRGEPTTPAGKSFIVRELLPIYREIKDDIEKVARVQQLARQLGLDERLLIAELKGDRLPQPPEPAPEETSRAILGLEEYCLSLIIANPPALAMANELLEQHNLPALSRHEFEQGNNREIFKTLQLWTSSEMPQLETLTNMVDQVLTSALTELAAYWQQRPSIPLEYVYQDLSKVILRIRLRHIARQIKELEILQREAIENNDTESALHYRELTDTHRQQRQRLELVRDALSLMGQRRTETDRYKQAAP